MSDKIDLKKEDFSFVCPIKTEDMTAIDGGYFCGECDKKVHDVSKMNVSEYKKLITKTENVCVSFKKVATVSLVLSLAACSSPEKTKAPLLGKIKAPNNTCQVDTNKRDKNETIRIEFNQIDETGGVPVPEPLMGVVAVPNDVEKK